MQKFTFDRRSTGLFSDQQNLFGYDQDQLLPFINRTFSKENVGKQIADKSVEFTSDKRNLLVKELMEQYRLVPEASLVKENIQALSEPNAFTITTGHQLSLFTGPLFFIYKILHVIRLCEELSKEYSEYRFVPVFWMASEDHDLEEVRSVEVFGKTLRWETEQVGAVGRMNTEGMDVLKATLRAFFEGKEGVDVDRILNAYTGETQAVAMFGMVHELFGTYGLVCVDGDNRSLKESFVPVMQKELKEEFSHEKVEEVSREIEQNGFKVQVKSREVNLFYINKIERERVLKEEGGFFLKGEGIKSAHETLILLASDPDRFSPNVILRPVYQEWILPNICYVGGVGELSYWLQLRGVFEEVGIAYPLLQARTSILFLDSVLSKRIEKAELQLEDLFKDLQELKRQKLKEQAGDELDFSEIQRSFNTFAQQLKEKIREVDSGLDKFAESEVVRMEKQLDVIQQKVTKSLKQRHENQLNTIDQLFQRLFPDGMMQERVLNLFSICPDGQVKRRIEQLYKAIDPFDPDLVVLMD